MNVPYLERKTFRFLPVSVLNRLRTSLELGQDQIAAALRSAASNVTGPDGVTLDETLATLSGAASVSKRLLAPASGCPGRVELVDIYIYRYIDI